MTIDYDNTNVFAKILRGEIPCHKVFESADVLAFMDVMPQADGHVLVVPKIASRNILDAGTEKFGALLAAVQSMARAVKAAFNADGVSIMQLNEPAAGQTVFHLHFHVIPRHSGVSLRSHQGHMEDQAILAANAEKIRSQIEPV